MPPIQRQDTVYATVSDAANGHLRRDADDPERAGTQRSEIARDRTPHADVRVDRRALDREVAATVERPARLRQGARTGHGPAPGGMTGRMFRSISTCPGSPGSRSHAGTASSGARGPGSVHASNGAGVRSPRAWASPIVWTGPWPTCGVSSRRRTRRRLRVPTEARSHELLLVSRMNPEPRCSGFEASGLPSVIWSSCVDFGPVGLRWLPVGLPNGCPDRSDLCDLYSVSATPRHE